MRLAVVVGALAALGVLAGACGGSSSDAKATATTAAATQSTGGGSGSTATTAAASASAATTTANAATSTTTSTTAAGTVRKVSANNATMAEITAALEAAGVTNASRWAKEVDEYRPYDANDPTMAKLRQNLAKYNPGPGVVDAIIATLSLP